MEQWKEMRGAIEKTEKLKQLEETRKSLSKEKKQLRE